MPLRGCICPENHALATEVVRSFYGIVNVSSGDGSACCRLCMEVVEQFHFATDGTVAPVLYARMAYFYSLIVDDSFHMHTVLQDLNCSVTDLVHTLLHRCYHGLGNRDRSLDHREYFPQMWGTMTQLIRSNVRSFIVHKDVQVRVASQGLWMDHLDRIVADLAGRITEKQVQDDPAATCL